MDVFSAPEVGSAEAIQGRGSTAGTSTDIIYPVSKLVKGQFQPGRTIEYNFKSSPDRWWHPKSTRLVVRRCCRPSTWPRYLCNGDLRDLRCLPGSRRVFCVRYGDGVRRPGGRGRSRRSRADRGSPHVCAEHSAGGYHTFNAGVVVYENWDGIDPDGPEGPLKPVVCNHFIPDMTVGGHGSCQFGLWLMFGLWAIGLIWVPAVAAKVYRGASKFLVGGDEDSKKD